MGILSPDPSNQPDDNPLSTDGANIIIPAMSSSDSEDEDLVHEGYEMLPQNENNLQHEESEEDCTGDEMEINSQPTVCSTSSSFDQARISEVKELWSSPNNERLSGIIMDSTKEEEVKNAMAGFSLPSSAIPPWARNIPEEEWKQQLIDRINSSNKNV